MGLFDKVKNAKQQAADAMAQARQTMGNAGGAGAAGAATAGAPGGFQMPNMDEQLKYRELAQKLSASGVEAPAVITAIRREGTDLSGSIRAEIDVNIKPADRDAYEATIKQSVIVAWLDELSPGSTVTVKYDPDSPASALMYGNL